MTKPPSNLKLALIRLRSLGDCVLTTPAIQLARSSGFAREIAVVVETPFRDLFLHHPDVSQVLEPSVSALRRFQPDLVVNLHGGPRSAWLTLASSAPRRAGFAHFRFPFLYHTRIPRAQQILGVEGKVHTAEHIASALFYLGVPKQPVPRAKLVAARTQRSRPYAVIHPLAATPDKTWPAANFLALARQLDLETVFLGAPTDDLEPFAEFERCQGPLADALSLLSGASLFVGNDSGPAHVAAAFGVPVVVLFGPSDEVIWAPWRTESRVLKHPDIKRIPVDAVLEAVHSLGARA